MKRRHFLQQALGAAGSLVAMGTATGRTPAGAAPASRPLRYGYQLNIFGGVGIVLAATQAYRKFGLNVEAVGSGASLNLREALVTGQLDMLTMAAVPFVVLQSRDPRYVVLLTTIYGGGTQAIVVRADSTIRSVADLKGKKVASRLGTSADATFQQLVLPRFGLRPSDVQILNLDFPDHAAALAAGTVDAFVGAEPFVSLAEDAGIGRVITLLEPYDMAPSFLVASQAFVQSGRPELRTFLEAWVEAYSLIKSDKGAFVDAIWKFYQNQGYGIERRIAERIVDRADFSPAFRPGLAEYMASLASRLKASGSIEQVPDFRGVLRNEVVADIMKRRGLL